MRLAHAAVGVVSDRPEAQLEERLRRRKEGGMLLSRQTFDGFVTEMSLESSFLKVPDEIFEDGDVPLGRDVHPPRVHLDADLVDSVEHAALDPLAHSLARAKCQNAI